MENDREVLCSKHKRDKDVLESEVEDKKQVIKRYENDYN